ncbi:lysine N(6)-hydroxylase/L-ornithine N(5)-oxygenase family protein [Nocardia sp. NPDC057663]|uniref:lysine N(6)-hydroxylase/L-ornithine N(5)-oxygenase family protein n=1 Tax=Nocardia sp. NPDC057663 TaxID=3346201 RepID=UPI0036722E73
MTEDRSVNLGRVPRSQTEYLAGKEGDVLDVVGVGYGPSNLALAVALEEHNSSADSSESIRSVFLDRKSSFGWHQGMLIEDATMQVSFIKDLVTMRNPTSRFSFLAYLHAHDRLADFVNLKSFFPARAEFHAYLEWVAAQLGNSVLFGSEVLSMKPMGDQQAIKVVFRQGMVQRTLLTRNVVLGIGITPSIPSGAELGPRVWHSSELLHRLELLGESPKRIIVVGAGQSAAEVTEYLHRRFDGAEVMAVHRRYGYSVADDTPFVNGIFDPSAVDVFFGATKEVKDELLNYHRNTNYGVVDQGLSEELYRRVYSERVSGKRRLYFFNATEIRNVDVNETEVRAEVTHLPSGEIRALTADILIYATGYASSDPLAILGDVAPYCKTEDAGRLQVNRDHSIVVSGDLAGSIFLNGGSEHSHGLSSTLLSNIGVRSGEILHSILVQQRDGIAG